MKWIILAWWQATRLFPTTISISKQLLPIYDKPMIYYPLSTLMLAWIKDILIITTPKDNQDFKNLLWDGSNLGINITYEIQNKPQWVAKAFVIWEKFIWNDDVCLILWDNLFYWNNISLILKNAINIVKNKWKSVIFWYKVLDPSRFWIVEFDKNNNILSIDEKPSIPKSNYAITWLYFYTNEVVNIAKNIKKSISWEYEITSINKQMLKNWNLDLKILWKNYYWFDTWTHESMLKASNFVQKFELKNWKKIWCIEEISYLNWWINLKKINKLSLPLINSSYWIYLNKISNK